MVGGLRIQQAYRRAEHAGDLRVVAAGVRRARARVALRMARHDQRVQLAEHGERRPVAAPATGVGPHTGQREARPRDQSELLERVLDEPGRLDLLEPELGVAPDLLAQPDDLLAAAVDGLVDPLLQLALCHGVLAAVTAAGYRLVWMGGSGALAGVLWLLATAGTAALALMWARRDGQVRNRHAFALGGAVFVVTFASFLVLGARGIEMFARDWLPL